MRFSKRKCHWVIPRFAGMRLLSSAATINYPRFGPVRVNQLGSKSHRRYARLAATFLSFFAFRRRKKARERRSWFLLRLRNLSGLGWHAFTRSPVFLDHFPKKRRHFSCGVQLVWEGTCFVSVIRATFPRTPVFERRRQIRTPAEPLGAPAIVDVTPYVRFISCQGFAR